MSAIVLQFEHSLALPLFGTGMKTDLFQSCGHCWVFQICWHIESSTFTASSFRIWSSSTGVPSHPLALFIVILYKAHWTLHSRMSGSRWVITLSWSSGSWRSFLCAYWVSDISYALWQMITGNHMYSYAHKNTSMLRNPAWSYQAQFFFPELKVCRLNYSLKNLIFMALSPIPT